jgi:hypothetical protein
MVLTALATAVGYAGLPIWGCPKGGHSFRAKSRTESSLARLRSSDREVLRLRIYKGKWRWTNLRYRWARLATCKSFVDTLHDRWFDVDALVR